VAGEVQMTFDTVSTSLQLIQDGKLRSLSAGRAELPDAPACPTWFSSGDERRLTR
jgi:tripartite-type tricarboxylate transporter receptor subunit TctC